MFINKKYFLFAVTGLLIFSHVVYANTGANQNTSVANASYVQSQVVAPEVAKSSSAEVVAKSTHADSVNLTDAQLINNVKSMRSSTNTEKTSEIVGKTQEKTGAIGQNVDTPVVAPDPAPVLQENQSQVELELNKKVPYKIYYLTKPCRLVVDIKDSAFSAEFDKSAFANSPIKNIRTSKQARVFRIVFDLNGPVDFQSSEQAGSNSTMKLVITISSKDKDSKNANK